MEYDDTLYILAQGEKEIPRMVEIAKLFGMSETMIESEQKRIQEILDKASLASSGSES